MQQFFSSLKPTGKSLRGFGQPFIKAVFFLALLLGGFMAKAQTANGRFYSYDFSAVTTQNITSYPIYFGNTTYLDTAALTITEGAGLSAGAAQFANAMTFQGVNSANEAAAVTANDYVQFTVNVKSGFEFRLDSLILRWQYQIAATNMGIAIRSSVDNYTQTLATVTQASGTAYSNQVTVFTLAKPLYSSTNITFRMYVWGANNQVRDFRITDGSATVNHDLSLWGRTTAVNSLMQAFDFSTSLGSETTRPTYTCDNTFIDTAGVTIVRGAGLTAQTTTAGSFGANGFNTNSELNAINGADYFEFQIKPKFGYEYSLDRISLRYFAATGVTNYTLRSSQNNYNSNIATGTLTQNANSTEDIIIRGPGVNTITALTSDSAITYRLYFWTTGTVALQARFTDGTANNTFNYDIACYGKMTTSAIPKVTLSAPGSVSTCLGGGISLKTSAVAGTAPYTVWLKDNLGNQRVHTQQFADSTFIIYPQSNRTYTMDSVKDVNGNKANSLTGTISVTVTSSPVIASSGTTIARTLSHLDGYTLTYASGDSCKSWIKITDSVGGTNPGSTTCTAEVLATSPMNTTARGYIPRRLNIAPTTNGIARVTLFYSQDDFTALNAMVTYQQKLPANSTDTVGVKTKIRIHRTASSLETASTTTFTPDSVTWNSTTSTWEVNFRVNDGVLGGNYYLSPQFTSTKLVTGLTHIASTPVIGQTSTSIIVDWDSLAGVAQYRVRYRPVGGTWSPATVTGSQRTLNYLAFNTSYEVQVRAYESASVQGEYTETYTFTTPASPGKLPNCSAPSNINATATSPVSVNISWTSALYAATYSVEMRLLNSLNWGGTSTSGNSVTYSYLTPGATYEYRVRTSCQTGYTENGLSSYSSIGTITMPSLGSCGTVTNLGTSSVSTNSATVKWSPVTYATSYQVQMRLKNSANWGGVTVSDTSYTFNYLSSSSIYEFRVRAYCNGTPVVTSTNVGSFSSTAEFTTNAVPVLPNCLPPTNIVATPTSNSVSITWNAASNAASYFVMMKIDTAASWGGGTTASTSRTYNYLSPSTSYMIRIRTNCSPGTTLNSTSVFSDTVIFVTTALANKAVFDTDATNEWVVYPNPTNSNVHVNFNSASEEPVNVIIRDMAGRMVQTQTYQPMKGSNTIDLNLESAADGLYMIHIYQGQTLQFMNRIQKAH